MEPNTKLNIALSDDARTEVGRLLNSLLADEYVLYATAHDYHWNVTGANFGDLHQLFEKQYEEVHLLLDEIAERARAIGVAAQGSWDELKKAARASAEAGTGLSAENMLVELLRLTENLIVQLRADVPTVALKGDAGTADFLTKVMEQHEKAAWMIRSHLQAREPITA